jgi:hypothetical protein
VNASQNNRIRSQAKDLLTEVWHRRDELWAEPPLAPEDLFPLDLERVIQGVLGLTLEEPEEISSAPGSASTGDVAGLIDRSARRIVVAQKYQVDWRRFTQAHEVGHFLLHNAIVYHRERILSGGELANRTMRSPVEQEADLFAAELLMPSKILVEIVNQRFGGPIGVSQLTDEAAHLLSAGCEIESSPSDFMNGGRRFVAMALSRLSTFGQQHFVPLVRRFGVSPTAMAIQLEDLRLVRN